MGKVKLNLPTGVVEEKNLITSFEEKENKYIILDADSVGSMGLPIILVCKIDNDRVVKISDANEWAEVKGYLKDIISGTGKTYISVADSLSADEGYFTQLTLPLASFETIKNAYVPQDAVTSDSAPTVEDSVPAVEEPAPVVDVSPSAEVPASNPIVGEELPAVETNPIVDTPSVAEEPAPVVEEPVVPMVEEPINVESAPVVEETTPVEPTLEAPAVDVVPSVAETPVVEQPAAETPAIETPVIEEPVVQETTVEAPVVEEIAASEPTMPTVDTPVEPIVEEVAPVQNTVASTEGNVGVGSKDAFMKACSDLYDAFVMTIKENK